MQLTMPFVMESEKKKQIRKIQFQFNSTQNSCILRKTLIIMQSSCTDVNIIFYRNERQIQKEL